MKNSRQNEIIISDLEIREGVDCTLVAVHLSEANNLLEILPMEMRCKLIDFCASEGSDIFVLRFACSLDEYFHALDDFVSHMLAKNPVLRNEDVEYSCSVQEFLDRYNVA